MIDTVIFFNWFHNGDIHVSRCFISEIKKYLNNSIKFFYFHKNDSNLLSDIDNLEIIRNNIGLNEHVISLQKNNILFLNTWYAADNRKYYNKYGLSFNCLYYLFEEHINRYFGLSLKNIATDPCIFYPEINYNKFYIHNIDKWNDVYKSYKKVLFCNCNAASGQSFNFSMDTIIDNMSKKYRGTLFITTNPTTVINDNVFYSKNIINKTLGSDLNENAYLGEKCDIIIGRLSGAHTFCYNKTNMFKNNKKFVCFTNDYNEALWYDSKNYALPYTCTIDFSNTSNIFEAQNIIDKNIKTIF